MQSTLGHRSVSIPFALFLVGMGASVYSTSFFYGRAFFTIRLLTARNASGLGLVTFPRPDRSGDDRTEKFPISCGISPLDW